MVNTIIRIRMLKIFYLSDLYFFYRVQIKYSIDKNQLRLSGEEERNDKIKRKMTDCTPNIKKNKIIKTKKLIF